MTKFRKHVLAGIVALGCVAGLTSVYAEKPGCDRMEGNRMFHHDGKSGERMKAHMAKRQAALHGKLKLTTAQEGAWSKFNERMQPGSPPARPDKAEIEKLSAPERMDRMYAMMKEREKKMVERIAAVKEFYAVLTPEQQKIFNDEFKPMRGHHRFGPA